MIILIALCDDVDFICLLHLYDNLRDRYKNNRHNKFFSTKTTMDVHYLRFHDEEEEKHDSHIEKHLVHKTIFIDFVEIQFSRQNDTIHDICLRKFCG